MNYLNDAENNMIKTIENLKERLITVRAGRASASMLNGIMAEYYGVPTPISQLANITVPEARELMIKPFDKTTLKDIEKAINEANLGINPINNGEVIILTVPDLNEDTRRSYVKQVKEMGENAKVSLRNTRQDTNNLIKKDDSLTEDQIKGMTDDVQELINNYNKQVDDLINEKEKELMSI